LLQKDKKRNKPYRF